MKTALKKKRAFSAAKLTGAHKEPRPGNSLKSHSSPSRF